MVVFNFVESLQCIPNEYFQIAISKLEITEYSDNFGKNTTALGDPVDIALEKFKDYPSVKIVKENVSTESLFHFREISVYEMRKKLSSFNSKKAGTFGNIQLKYLRQPLISVIKCFKQYGIAKF